MVIGLPAYQEVFLWSLLLSVVMVLLQKYLTNQSVIKNIKREMKSLQDRMKKAQKSGNTKEMNKLSGEMMRLSGKQMQQNMRPMMASFVIFILAIGWISSTYSELSVSLPFGIPFIGESLNWFWWYFLTVLPVNFALRKVLDVQ